jgi:hypothetical protein
MANDAVTSSMNDPVTRCCSKYWLEDGSLIVMSPHSLYKVHKTLLFRHSPTIAKWADHGHLELVLPKLDDYLIPQLTGCAHVIVPDDIRLRDEDLEALLEHLYHDM